MSALIRERFREPPDAAAQGFVASIEADRKLVAADIRGSMAHAEMLGATGLITRREAARLRSGLGRILRDWTSGRWQLDVADEDVHMNVERRLRRIVGPRLAAKLHTGRSRNDQVALDLRLWLRDAGARLTRAVADLRQSLARRAREHAATILPGVTHLQHAQAVSLGHVLLCYCDRLERDAGRLRDALERADVSPLGAGALAGTSLRIAPQRTARALGFPATFANSIDAVSDRDFAVEYVSACAILVTHLSQMAEDLILWSCPEFGFIELPDALTTSSSMLPQKKNPDLVELVRGKAGAVFGHLMSLLATLKALPIGYNRDLQETKPPLFAAAETALECVVAMERAVAGFVANTSRMLEAARDPGLLAIDLAESLVEKGVAFREAHGIVARLIRDCSEQGVSPAALSLNRLRGYSPAFDAEALRRLTPAASAARRLSPGGTAPILVARRARRLSRRSS